MRIRKHNPYTSQKPIQGKALKILNNSKIVIRA